MDKYIIVAYIKSYMIVGIRSESKEGNKIVRKLALIFMLTFLLSMLASIQAPARVQSFSLRNLDGDLVKLDDYLGKGPIILDFWATWCKPCVKSLPKLQKLYEAYKDKGLIVLGINEDGPRSLSKVEPFANSLGLTFPILLDENREVVRKYQVSGFPTMIIIDRNKKIVNTIIGYRPGDEKKLKVQIEALLKEK